MINIKSSSLELVISRFVYGVGRCMVFGEVCEVFMMCLLTDCKSVGHSECLGFPSHQPLSLMTI